MPKHSKISNMIKKIVAEKQSKPKKPVRGSRITTNKKKMNYGKKKNK